MEVEYLGLGDWMVRNEDGIEDIGSSIAGFTALSVGIWYLLTILAQGGKPCIEDNLWCEFVYWWVPLNPMQGGGAIFFASIGAIIIPIGIIAFIVGKGIGPICDNWFGDQKIAKLQAVQRQGGEPTVSQKGMHPGPLASQAVITGPSGHSNLGPPPAQPVLPAIPDMYAQPAPLPSANWKGVLYDDGYERLEHPQGSGVWYWRDQQTGQWVRH
jgi:hypothetical protein